MANLERDVASNRLFDWNDAARSRLQANGLVALPGKQKIQRFDEAYSMLKDDEMPILVTTDSTLHLFHIFFDQLLKNVEVRYFVPMFRALLHELALTLASIYEPMDGDLKEAARRNLAFISVAGRLVDPLNFPLHPAVADEVTQVVEYVETAGRDLDRGRELSPIFNRQCPRGVACFGGDLDDTDYQAGKACYCEDYTQYKPRGHYTETEDLELYFRSAMYLGRMAMRLKSPMETRMAALLTAAMNKTSVSYGGVETAAPVLWDRIYRTVSFFVGAADDLTFVEYDKLLREVYGENFSMHDLADDDKLETLRSRLKEEREPQILSGFVHAMLDTTEQTMGLRFLGQRFAFDSYTLGELVFKNVGANPNHPDYPYVIDNLDGSCVAETEEEKITHNFDQCDGMSLADWHYICCSAAMLGKLEVCRMMPTGLDVAAAFGSNRARQFLREDIEGYCSYEEQLDSLDRETSAFTDDDWWRALYTGWLYTLQPLLTKDLTGFPAWMTTDAYKDKSLNTALASWAELRHDTILYVKQSYTSMMDGGMEIPPEIMYWVEPMPEVYQALSDLTKLTRTGLTDMGLFDSELDRPVGALVELLDTLTSISINELEGKALTENEKFTIENVGDSIQSILTRLGKVTMQALEKPQDDPDAWEELEVEGDTYKTTVIADVHTDPNTDRVLEVGSGYIHWMVIVRRIDDETLGAAIGPIFSYYEFPWPIQDRLDDEQWQALLNGSGAPARPEFLKGLYPE